MSRRTDLIWIGTLLLLAPAPGAAQGNNNQCGGRKPQYTDPSYQSTFTGQIVIATCGTFNPGDPVLVIWDLKNQATAPLDQQWGTSSVPPTAFYHDPSWTQSNLGNVFGVTLDETGNIYLAAGSAYNTPIGPAGPGAIYKIAASTGAISTFATLPNSGPALGNIDYNSTYHTFYVSNLDDGLIYLLDASGNFVPSQAWDHGANLPSATPPGLAIPDDPSQAGTPLGRRIWGLHTSGSRLYYSVWWEDEGHRDAAHSNEIWSVGLDNTGAFLPGTQKLEISMPPVAANVPKPYSNPVADISFGPVGDLLLAERTTNDIGSPGAHDSRGLEYTLSGGVWAPSGVSFSISQLAPPGSAAGGVAQDFGAGGRVWFTGDALHIKVGDNIYGLQGLPAAGGDIHNSILIDLDNSIVNQAKTLIGDVAIPCPANLLDPSIPIPTLSQWALATLALGLSLAGLCLLRDRTRRI